LIDNKLKGDPGINPERLQDDDRNDGNRRRKSFRTPCHVRW